MLTPKQISHNLRFQIHTGNQHWVEMPERAVAMPLTMPGQPQSDINVVTLADKLKAAKYSTHCVGKWHLGLFQTRYWPTERGFDTFLGILPIRNLLGVSVKVWVGTSLQILGVLLLLVGTVKTDRRSN